jgi:hypothetical protein
VRTPPNNAPQPTGRWSKQKAFARIKNNESLSAISVVAGVSLAIYLAAPVFDPESDCNVILHPASFALFMKTFRLLTSSFLLLTVFALSAIAQTP